MFSISSVPNQKYSNDKVIAKIKIIRLLESSNPNSAKIPKLKYQIFCMMKNLVVKNINNYLKYSRNSSVADLSFNSHEMESEAFLILDKCIEKFNIKYDFYFFYNKALSRNFYRMFDKTDRDNTKDIDFRQVNKRKLDNNFSKIELKVDLFNIGLGELEIIVLESKLAGETKEMFIYNNPDFPMSKYYDSLQNLKKILKTLQEDGEL